MSNHYHIVVRLAPQRAATWSDAEVVERWSRIFKCPLVIDQYAAGPVLDRHDAARLALWRERLGSLSWFMRCLNECIARRANTEDGCSGRFWEGRYHSQALLDEQALLTAMAYVDLNPVRAEIADTLETSDYTAVQTRLRATQSAVIDNTVVPLLAPFAQHGLPQGTEPLPFTWPAYLELVTVTGRILRCDKRGVLVADPPQLLQMLRIQFDEWSLSVTLLRHRFERVLGSPRRLQLLAERTGQRWFHGQRAARRYYAQPPNLCA